MFAMSFVAVGFSFENQLGTTNPLPLYTVNPKELHPLYFFMAATM